MLLKLVEYHWAEDIDDVLLLLGRLDVKTVPLAGGTHLLSLQDETIEAVVDLRDLGLAYISEDRQGLHIGAMTTLQQLADEPLLKEFASGLLARSALLSSSSHLIRNGATLGGTLGAGIAAQADLLTVLAALDAEVVVRSGSKTQLDLSGGTLQRPGLPLAGVIFKGKQERRIASTSLQLERRPSELIIEVIIPHPSVASGASFQRVARTPNDVALLNAAAIVETQNGLYSRVRLAFGGRGMEPVRMPVVERQLEGQPVIQPFNNTALIAALQAGMVNFRPASDLLVSGSYRRVSAMSVGYRALEEAMTIASWRSMLASEKGV
ncbi:FAD binding domain-containing protein [Tengunoibacter tsumagoiensis]|uniref:FAD-binding PCMH-type domain-containing protein n=1 Tax=Tengunoibacter tsumagoiensis TaxID=2014871 RepID=A0A401ZXM6_9CHLR|nr:FAD binding domain-containing protein [Tengunoibacter tsumagoiensis]GCE11585.1 hypothetical protein KTT_14440 [Tengunoibacter tsumagoiensis]